MKMAHVAILNIGFVGGCAGGELISMKERKFEYAETRGTAVCLLIRRATL